MLRLWLCNILPWHRLVRRKRISAQSDYLRCSCGAEYGHNHDVGVTLPWHMVSSFYERKAMRDSENPDLV